MHLLLSTDEIKKLSYLCWDDAYIKHLQLESHTYFRVQMLPSAPKKKKKQSSHGGSHASFPYSPQNYMEFSLEAFKLGSISVTYVLSTT